MEGPSIQKRKRWEREKKNTELGGKKSSGEQTQDFWRLAESGKEEVFHRPITIKSGEKNNGIYREILVWVIPFKGRDPQRRKGINMKQGQGLIDEISERLSGNGEAVKKETVTKNCRDWG